MARTALAFAASGVAVSAKLSSLPLINSTLPPLVPVSTTYASTDPAASAAWMVEFMDAELIQQNVTADAGCGEIAWVRLPGSGYEFHFVSNPAKPVGETLDIVGYVAYVEGLYGNLSEVRMVVGGARAARRGDTGGGGGGGGAAEGADVFHPQLRVCHCSSTRLCGLCVPNSSRVRAV